MEGEGDRSPPGGEAQVLKPRVADGRESVGEGRRKRREGQRGTDDGGQSRRPRKTLVGPQHQIGRLNRGRTPERRLKRPHTRWEDRTPQVRQRTVHGTRLEAKAHGGRA